MQELQLTDQEQARRDKVLKLKELGIDPFGHAFKTNSNTQEIFKKYQGQNPQLQIRCFYLF